MGRVRHGTKRDPDRYLLTRGGVYYYRRRVPEDLADLDTRGPILRQSLKTDDLAKARRIRDALEAADDQLWASILGGDPYDVALARYQSAARRAVAMGFVYRQAHEIAREETVNSIVGRIEAIVSAKSVRQEANAALGLVERPKVPMTKAWEVFAAEIAPRQLVSKSEGQRRRWTNGKKASVDDFVAVVGDISIEDITRDDARRYYDHWMARIAPREGMPSHTASIGNRRLGDLRGIFSDYFTRLGLPDRKNPFERLSFREKKGKRLRKRPPIPDDWIVEHFLRAGRLAGLNREARAILLMVAVTGARPSEICNLTPGMIRIDARVPHIAIEPREGPEDPREIKTESSIRIVPLVGLALEVMKKWPAGFARYKDKESALSATLGKFCRENGLFPSVRHKVYSLRHSFEDRMKNAGIGDDMRRILMGHAIDRPEYGEGGSLDLRQSEMLKVALPYDPGIV